MAVEDSCCLRTAPTPPSSTKTTDQVSSKRCGQGPHRSLNLSYKETGSGTVQLPGGYLVDDSRLVTYAQVRELNGTW